MILAERALLASVAAAVGTWAAARVGRRIGLLDHPGPRKLHPAPVPLAGGVGLGAGVVAGIVGAGITHDVLVGGGVLLVLGFLDDARDLRARTRLLGQAAAAFPVALAYAPSIGVARPIEVAFALLWILAVISAVNCIDCADAVAASIAIAASVALGSLGGWEGQAGALASAVAGAAGGFLFLNAPPARAFLGEGGSTLLGFLLAVLALAVTGAAPPDRSLATGTAAVVVMAVPLMDFVLVHVRRMRNGIRRFSDLMVSAGTDHLPHRLRAAGLSPWVIAAACAGATTVGGLAALASRRVGLTGAVLGGLGVGAALLLAEAAIEHHPRHARTDQGRQPAMRSLKTPREILRSPDSESTRVKRDEPPAVRSKVAAGSLIREMPVTDPKIARRDRRHADCDSQQLDRTGVDASMIRSRVTKGGGDP